MKKKIYKSNGIKTASPADCLERDEINKLKDYFLNLDLSKINNLRNLALLTFNLNVGLRAGDLLSLPKELIIKNDQVVSSFAINEQKTGKKRIIELNRVAKEIIQKYYEAFYNELKHSYWLFPSRKKKQGSGHLAITSFNRILKEAHRGTDINPALTISSHFARKTLGSFLYEKGIALDQIQNMFNHNKPETTLIYISVLKRKSQHLYHEVEL
jgi:site-specific recombinase XerD